MKRSVLGILTAVLTLASAAPALAGDDIVLGVPGYGGNGCPAGSASVTLSPDQKSLSILFDQFIAEAGSTTGKRVDRKSCNIAIPVRVPQGYSIALFQVDYRGFNSLPRGALSRFTAEYFWAGSRGRPLTTQFSGPLTQDYQLTDNVIATSLVWTPCGANTNLRVNASMMVQANNRMEQALSTVDSADVTSGLIYHIQWQRCR